MCDCNACYIGAIPLLNIGFIIYCFIKMIANYGVIWNRAIKKD